MFLDTDYRECDNLLTLRYVISAFLMYIIHIEFNYMITNQWKNSKSNGDFLDDRNYSNNLDEGKLRNRTNRWNNVYQSPS